MSIASAGCFHVIFTHFHKYVSGGPGKDARIRRLQIDGVTPSQLSYTDMALRSAVGSAEMYFLPLDSYGWVFPVVTGHNKTYIMDWRDAGE